MTFVKKVILKNNMLIIRAPAFGYLFTIPTTLAFGVRAPEIVAASFFAFLAKKI